MLLDDVKEKAKTWLEDALIDKEDKEEIKIFLERENFTELQERFYKDLELTEILLHRQMKSKQNLRIQVACYFLSDSMLYLKVDHIHLALIEIQNCFDMM